MSEIEKLQIFKILDEVWSDEAVHVEVGQVEFFQIFKLCNNLRVHSVNCVHVVNWVIFILTTVVENAQVSQMREVFERSRKYSIQMVLKKMHAYYVVRGIALDTIPKV